jgi:predicted flap endonuclease-1-like 5' DNA nuclease
VPVLRGRRATIEPAHLSESGEGARKKPYARPTAVPFTEATELPDSLPGAEYLRQAGIRTYHQLFALSPAQLAAAEEHLGADAVRAIRALAGSPG